VDIILLYFAVKLLYQPRAILVSRGPTREIVIKLKPIFQFTQPMKIIMWLAVIYYES